jgi:uncharacterized Zn finger protein
MAHIPLVTAQAIANYCGKKIFFAGKQFLNSKEFLIFYRDWMILKAICEGNSNPSYLVKIVFDQRGISNSSCTCNCNRVGPCKHIAALLMMWHEKPSLFPDRVQWVRHLKSIPKKELVLLIEKMIDLYPDTCDTNSSLMGES